MRDLDRFHGSSRRRGVLSQRVFIRLRHARWGPCELFVVIWLALANLAEGQAPEITTQPKDQTVIAGSNASFSVVATGAEPLFYQWRKEGTNVSDGGLISGATATNLVLSNVQFGDGGAYNVVVSNAAGSVTSQVAVLTVPLPPTMTTQPQNQSAPLGLSATFTVAVSGTPPLFYQWRHDAMPIATATNAELTLTGLQFTDAGTYSVLVTNAYGIVASSNATLSVINVAAWGWTNAGQIDVPPGLNNAISISAGYDQNLAMKADSAAIGWGDNSYGESDIPASLSNVVALASGRLFSLALKANGTVVAWGSNDAGETNVPSGLCNVVAITSGSAWHVQVVKADGTVVSWGDNSAGQTTTPPGLSNVVAIGTGSSHTIALRADGTVVAWGLNSWGVCQVPTGLTNVIAIASGNAHSLALMPDGTVVAWGDNRFGHCSVPLGLTNVVAIAAGLAHSLALKADGTVVAWGGGTSRTGVEPEYGQCMVPPGLTGVTSIAAGSWHSLALIGTGAPALTVHPWNRTVLQGDTLSLHARAVGVGQLSYQWYRNGAPVPEATKPSLALTNVFLSQQGNYSVVVSNSFGAVTSTIATLTVAQRLVLSQQGRGAVTATPTNYSPGATVILTATPGRWYEFIRWSDGVTDNPRTITIGLTNRYTALFTNTVPLELHVLKEWERVYGGTDAEAAPRFLACRDGGYLMSSLSMSGISGNKSTPNYGGYDYWIVKLDSLGVKEWEKNYGGDAPELIEHTVIQTSEGGYLLIGGSRSGVSGNKATAKYGEADLWLLKLDSAGNKEWEHTYGGSAEDFGTCGTQLRDGGFLVGGVSYSGVSGNKTAPGYGGSDMWLLRLDANGNKIWDRSYGTPNNADELWFVDAKSNGEIIVAGRVWETGGNWTNSAIGFFDGAAMGLTAGGEILWQRDYGGSGGDILLSGCRISDDEYVLSGMFDSGTGAGYDSWDAWVLKTDGQGNLQWQDIRGGGLSDNYRAVSVNQYGEILGIGDSRSGPTAGQRDAPNWGLSDAWVAKFGPTGAKRYDVSWGGSNDESYTTALATSEGGFFLASQSTSDVSGNKTVVNFSGASDIWVIKVAELELPVGTPLVFVDGGFANAITNVTVTESNVAQITLQTSFTNGAIFYTLDGSAPSTNATRYAGPFTVTNTSRFPREITLRAVAYSADDAQATLADPVQISIIPRPLYVATLGRGTVSENPDQTSYAGNQVVTLTATPERFYRFLTWSDGDTNNPRTITIALTNRYTAIFTNTVPLELTVLKEWERVYGGTDAEIAPCFLACRDGGYLMSCLSMSGISGNKGTTNYGNYDYWIMKLNSLGWKEWERGYGGDNYEVVEHTVIAASEGGYLLIGGSRSGVSGNKATGNYGEADVWLIKLDPSGNKEWERAYGGSAEDYGTCGYQLPDGGFLVGGVSYSSPSGNKTAPGYGGSDMWLLRLNSTGEKIWERTYGTPSSGDELYFVDSKTSGEILVAGRVCGTGGSWTNLASGGGAVMGLTADGDILWQHRYGVSGNDVLLTGWRISDDEYVLGGIFDRGNVGGYEGWDAWILKTDGSGRLLWQDIRGGDLFDVYRGISVDKNGELLGVGNSRSGPTANQRDAPNWGLCDAWVVKFAPNGEKRYDASWGGTNDETQSFGFSTSDGGFVLASQSNSDVSGNKTVANFSGAPDIWVTKVAEVELPVGTPVVLVNGLFSAANQHSIPATNSIQVQLQTSFTNATIFYSLDGSDPLSGNVYDGTPFPIVDSVIVRAVAADGYLTNFAEADVVTITVVPVYTLAVTTDGLGSVTLEPPGGAYLSNSVVTLTATPAAEWMFSGWTGGGTGAEPVVQVLMNGNKAIEASFEQIPRYPLVVTTAGGGSVSNNPSGISFLSNTLVCVAATPSNGWTFLGWTGDWAGTNTNSCLVMDRARSVEGMFGTPVSVTTVGNGTVQRSPPQGPFPFGEVLRLSAVPNAGNCFRFWGGAASGNSNSPLDFIVTNANPTVSAVFAALPSNHYALTVLINGDGSVTQAPQRSYYTNGLNVTLTANPGEGSVFTGWNGDAAGSANPLTVTMTNSKTITAMFASALPPTITTQPQDQSVLLASNAVFSVSVSGAEPLAYQWWFNETNAILAGTNVSLVLTNVQFADGGRYHVVVTSAHGSATSSIAWLTVVLPNSPPSVTLTAPNDGALFTAPANILLSATATDSNGMITQIEFFAGEVLLGTLSNSLLLVPFTGEMTWSNVALGDYSLTARAVDDGRLATTSSPVSIIVQTAVPVIALTSPTNGNIFLAPATILLNALAQDADNSIAQVEFYVGTNLLAALTNPPYSLVWSNVSEGSYALLAVARDRYGPVVTSTPPAGITVTTLTTNTPVFQWSNTVYEVSEGAATVVLTVLKNANSPAATISYATANGTAIAGPPDGQHDYGAKQGVLSFAAGETAQTISIAIHEDALIESNQFFTVGLSFPSSGSITGSEIATVVILDNEPTGCASFLARTPTPIIEPSALGSLRLNLEPPAALGQWRFTWEFDWRDGGSVLHGLLGGNYEVEFKPVVGYGAPIDRVISLLSSVTNEYTFYYTNTELPQYGSLTVIIEPPIIATNADINQRGQWRRQGETVWHDSGEMLDPLAAGSYIIEFKPVIGSTTAWSTPGNRLANVVADRDNPLTAYYYVAPPDPGAPPLALPFSQVNGTYAAGLPYGYCGQIQSDTGYGSGCVVKDRVVLTAAHVVFDDRALSYVPVGSVKWLLQRQSGVYEPPPKPPRGWCVLSGYAAARQADASPGLSSVASQDRDVAALYFLESAGGGGYSGYLVSRSPGAEWLYKGTLQTLVGYPVEGVLAANRGQMHATALQTVDWQVQSNQVHSTTNIKSYPGNSGGPLCVQLTNSTFLYPGAVFLGGSGRTVVRAIDCEVADLIVAAEVLGDSGGQSTGGGPIRLGVGQTLSPLIYGFFTVQLLPPEVADAGAAYRFKEATNGEFYAEQTNLFAMLGNGVSYTLQFNPVFGYTAPPDRVVSVASGQTADVVGQYVPVPLSIVTPPVSQVFTTGQTLTLSVSARGRLPFAYSWEFNGTNLAGATNATLRVTNLTVAQAGRYRAIVSNNYGETVESAEASLTYFVPLIILTHPVSQVATAGQTVVFAVAANGTPPLRFRWQFQERNLQGATNSTLIVSNVYPTYAGPYQAIVKDDYGGAVTSQVATLSVLATPALLSLDRGLGLTIRGATGFTYRIDHAAELNPSQWRPLTTTTLSGSSQLIPGAVPTSVSNRFFRAVSP